MLHTGSLTQVQARTWALPAASHNKMSKAEWRKSSLKDGFIIIGLLFRQKLIEFIRALQLINDLVSRKPRINHTSTYLLKLVRH